jgi:hypothetical protein
MNLNFSTVIDGCNCFGRRLILIKGLSGGPGPRSPTSLPPHPPPVYKSEIKSEQRAYFCPYISLQTSDQVTRKYNEKAVASTYLLTACVLFGECTIWRMYHLANVPFGE